MLPSAQGPAFGPAAAIENKLIPSASGCCWEPPDRFQMARDGLAPVRRRARLRRRQGGGRGPFCVGNYRKAPRMRKKCVAARSRIRSRLLYLYFGKTEEDLKNFALRDLGTTDDTATVARHLAGLSRQVEELDRNLRIANETAAHHARFHLAVTPLLPAGELGAACALGAERFEEFAAQVGRRVDLGIPLIRETIDRVSATRTVPLTPAEGDPSGTGATLCEPDVRAPSLAEDVSPPPVAAVREDAATLGLRAVEAALFPDSATCRVIKEGERAVPSRQSVPTWLTAPRRAAKDPVEKRSLILRVFLPFDFGYYIAFLFRTINAVMAAPLAKELGLGANDLGLLTSIYFLTFAAAQIPVGILLDRYGPRQVVETGNSAASTARKPIVAASSRTAATGTGASSTMLDA